MRRKLIVVFIGCLSLIVLTQGTKAIFKDKDVVTGNSITTAPSFEEEVQLEPLTEVQQEENLEEDLPDEPLSFPSEIDQLD